MVTTMAATMEEAIRSSKEKNVGKRLNNIMFFLAGVLSVLIIGILAIGITTWAQNNKTPQDEPQDYTTGNLVYSTQESWQNGQKQSTGDRAEEKWQEGVIEYNGKHYQFNSKLDVYLLMGIDKSGPVREVEDYTKGGQSDAMFLLVADPEKEQMSVISINRNTMVDVYTCDSNGNSIGDVKAQLCVQHGFGDGAKLSCSRTMTAVQKLFYNVPIKGYISFNMDAINQINNVVGGVTVDVLQDMKGDGISLKKGETVTLSDEEAYLYLRGRDLSEYGSATDRLRRQEQYISAFIKQIKGTAGITTSKVESLYSKVSEYTVTSVDFVALVSAMLDYEYDDSRMYTVPGKLQMGDKLEEYNVDEQAFYDQVINVFYQEVGGV